LDRAVTRVQVYRANHGEDRGQDDQSPASQRLSDQLPADHIPDDRDHGENNDNVVHVTLLRLATSGFRSLER
jgi:hypothetical protein